MRIRASPPPMSRVVSETMCARYPLRAGQSPVWACLLAHAPWLFLTFLRIRYLYQRIHESMPYSPVPNKSLSQGSIVKRVTAPSHFNLLHSFVLVEEFCAK